MVSLIVTITFAQNYQMGQYVISSGGDQSESDDFKVKCTIGQPIIGTTSSSNLISKLGFWNNTIVSSYAYFPGDANMFIGIWPPQVIGSDVTYIVSYFRGLPNEPCLLDGFWASADVNGDCNIIGSDVTRLVNCFRGIGSIEFCPDYPPAWYSEDDFPLEQPDGWPNCENAPINSNVIPTNPVQSSRHNNRIIIDNPQLTDDQKELTVDVYLTSEDPIAFICLPLAWQGIDITPKEVIPGTALTNWDAVSSDIKYDEKYMLMLAWHDLGGEINQPLNTNGDKALIYRLVFDIENIHSLKNFQLIPSEDSRNGGVLVCLDDGVTCYQPEVQIDWADIALAIDNDPELPTVYSLSQNYPNPFNPKTTIKYGLPEASHVTIGIYDILGRNVVNLVNAERPAGYHQVTWCADNASSGMYFYKIKAGEFIDTRKMLLLK